MNFEKYKLLTDTVESITYRVIYELTECLLY